jgi:hypothetical protein
VAAAATYTAAVTAAPVKPEFGPALPELLRRRLDRAPAWARRGLWAAVVAATAAIVVAVGLLASKPSYSHGGALPFSFPYSPRLHRVASHPGGFVRVEQRRAGRLVQSFEVAPLRLGAYEGRMFAELPLFADGYIRRLRSTLPGFQLVYEGRTPPTNPLGYQILYSYRGPAGEDVFGRDELLLRDRPGAREALLLVMRATRLAGVIYAPAVGVDGGSLTQIVNDFSYG